MNWIITDEILKHPEKYYNKDIIFGSQYSLVTDKIVFYKKYLPFPGPTILECINTDNSIYLLVELTSLEAYNLLEAQFRVKGMSLPEMSEHSPVSLQHYTVTAILPDGTQRSFSQVLRSDN
jgi:hypothetical protein